MKLIYEQKTDSGEVWARMTLERVGDGFHLTRARVLRSMEHGKERETSTPEAFGVFSEFDLEKLESMIRDARQGGKEQT